MTVDFTMISATASAVKPLDKKVIIRLVKDLAKKAEIDVSGVVVRDVGALVLQGYIQSCLDIRVYVPEAGFELLKAKYKGATTQVTYGRAHKRAGESYEYLMFPYLSVQARDPKVRIWTEKVDGGISCLSFETAQKEIKAFGYSPDIELLQMAELAKKAKDAEEAKGLEPL